MKRAALAAIFAAAFAFSFTYSTNDAVAQKKAAKKKKAKNYDFSGDDITGDLIKPDGMGFNARKFAIHTSLIRIRTNFIKEILKSAEDL